MKKFKIIALVCCLFLMSGCNYLKTSDVETDNKGLYLTKDQYWTMRQESEKFKKEMRNMSSDEKLDTAKKFFLLGQEFLDDALKYGVKLDEYERITLDVLFEAGYIDIYPDICMRFEYDNMYYTMESVGLDTNDDWIIDYTFSSEDYDELYYDEDYYDDDYDEDYDEDYEMSDAFSHNTKMLIAQEVFSAAQTYVTDVYATKDILLDYVTVETLYEEELLDFMPEIDVDIYIAPDEPRVDCVVVDNDVEYP